MAVDLRLDWCSHAAAKFSVENWHYSKSLPPPPHCRVGVWEGGKFIGCILYARGASSNLLTHYGLDMTEGAELVRVALAKHETPVSRIMAISFKFLKSKCPGLRLIVSFADPFQGHHGGIYQATNWIYAGVTSPSYMYKDRAGKLWHSRMISSSGVGTVFGKKRKVLTPDQCVKIKVPGKHRYLMPLDPVMRSTLEHLSRPYPKRAGSIGNDATPIQGGKGGATPTPALHIRAVDN